MSLLHSSDRRLGPGNSHSSPRPNRNQMKQDELTAERYRGSRNQTEQPQKGTKCAKRKAPFLRLLRLFAATPSVVWLRLGRAVLFAVILKEIVAIEFTA